MCLKLWLLCSIRNAPRCYDAIDLVLPQAFKYQAAGLTGHTFFAFVTWDGECSRRNNDDLRLLHALGLAAKARQSSAHSGKPSRSILCTLHIRCRNPIALAHVCRGQRNFFHVLSWRGVFDVPAVGNTHDSRLCSWLCAWSSAHGKASSLTSVCSG